MLQTPERDGQPDLSVLYGPEYYASHCGPVPYARTEHWLGFFGGVADVLIRSFAPRRVFDAGCAIGLLVEAFWDRGVEAHGRDLSEWAIGQVRADVRSWCQAGSIADPVGAEYDLITCIEVLEHMPEVDAIRAVHALAAAAPRILFSSSPTDLEEPTHINVRPPAYWLSLWASVGFAPSVTHDAGYLAPHAYVVERSDKGHSERELVAFADRVRHRVALSQVGALMHTAQARALELGREVSELKVELGAAAVSARALQDDAAQREASLVGRAEAAEHALRAATEAIELAQAQLVALTSEVTQTRRVAAHDAEAAGTRYATSQADAIEQRRRAEIAERSFRLATAASESAQAALSARKTDLVVAQHALEIAQTDLVDAQTEAAVFRGEVKTAYGLRDHALARVQTADAETAAVRGRVQTARRNATITLADYKAISNSTTWFVTGPVRLVAGVLPRPVRRRVRQAVFLTGWVATFQIFKRLEGRKLMLARARLIEASRYFNADWYRATYPDVAESGLVPAVHYAARGGPEGRDPGPAFHTQDYLERFPEAVKEPGGVFMHALSHGEFAQSRSSQDVLQSAYIELPLPIIELPDRPSPDGKFQLSADDQTPKPPPPAADALLAARFPDLTALPVFAAPHAQQRRLTVVTDSINSGSLYGGVGTALIMGALAARRLGAGLRLVTRIEPPEVANVGATLDVHGISWDTNIEFVHAPRGDGVGGRDIPVSADDMFLTTSWWTTWSTCQSVPRDRIAYLLQEDERMFYPLGDDHLRCTEVLSDPNMLFLVNSELLLTHLRGAGLAPNGTAFEPSFPTRVYHPAQPKLGNIQGKRGFFFYARPHNPRNLYWRGVEALSAAIEEGVLDPEDWEFHFAGHGAGPMSLPRGARAVFPGPMTWAEYASMTGRMDVGLCLMDTPHPSYPPLDLAASGAVVVTNRFGPKVELDRYSANILCADPDVPSLVVALRNATTLAADHHTRSANFARNGLQRDWVISMAPALDRIAQWAKA